VTRRTSAEDGFTLVELLVAMVLGAIVLALIVGAIIDMFGSSERSAMKSKAERSAVAAVEMLTSDLRAARAPEREPFYTGSADNLRNLILFQRDQGLLVHDIAVATPTRLAFYAELDNTSPRAECVVWAVQPNGSLRRTVYPFTSNCAGASGAARQDSEVMPPAAKNASALAKPPQPFTYRLLAHPANVATVRPNACTTPTRTTAASALERDQITSVELDLRSFVAGKVGRGDQELITAVSISSRQAQEYRYAIGCVA
jgi:prepilin-type N-terminal cleavage/methylation domain-containing protein